MGVLDSVGKAVARTLTFREGGQYIGGGGVVAVTAIGIEHHRCALGGDEAIGDDGEGRGFPSIGVGIVSEEVCSRRQNSTRTSSRRVAHSHRQIVNPRNGNGNPGGIKGQSSIAQNVVKCIPDGGVNSRR